MDEEYDSEDEEYNVYGEDAREELTEADEIDDDEEGFMRGYESTANPVYCDNCKVVLSRNHIEKEIGAEIYSFCSEECADEFERKKGRGD